MAYTSSYTGEQLDTYVTKKQVIDLIYPIGAIYQTTSDTHPNVLFPGTAWLKIEGRFLLGTGTFGATSNSNSTYGSIHSPTNPSSSPAGEKGGQEYHILTINEMPSHYHQIYGFTWGDQSMNYYLVLQNDGNLVIYKTVNGTVSAVWQSGTYGQTGTTNVSHLMMFGVADGSTTYTGGGWPHNNMPPYKVVNIWKRVG